MTEGPVEFTPDQDSATIRRGADADPNRTAETETRIMTPAPAAPAPARVGALGIDGWVLGDELGRGAQGVVYRATPAAGGPPVALKVLRAEASDAEVARFEKCVATMRALADVEGVLHVLAAGRSNLGRPWFTTDLVQGGTLREALERSVLDPRTLALLLADVADALHQAHDRGIVHRDLKPENVLLDPTIGGPVPLVADFGLARDLSDGKETLGGGAGTPAYMAPEQFAGGPITRRTDVWALGAILYEIIAGIPPFKRPTLAEMALAVAEERPRPPVTLWSGLPDALAAVALRALEKDPNARYPTAALFAQDVERALRGESVAGRAFRRPRRRGRLAKLALAVHDAIDRRRRFALGAVLGVVVGLGVGFVVARAGVLGDPIGLRR